MPSEIQDIHVSDQFRQPLLSQIQIKTLILHLLNTLKQTIMVKKHQPKPEQPAPAEKKEKITKPKKYAKTEDAIYRINKSKNQRIFLISAKRQQDHYDFVVEGTASKNYKVSTGLTVKCSCMDFTFKKKPCKHIYFIVTQVAQNEEILDYFRNSTTISKNAYKVLDDQLEKRLRSRLENMNSKKDSKDIDLKDDKDCVICFTEMDKNDEALEDCGTCKKYFHTQCIGRWKQHNPTCPLCRGNLVGSGKNPLEKLQQITV